jgi:histidine triad (HIT) family protein
VPTFSFLCFLFLDDGFFVVSFWSSFGSRRRFVVSSFAYLVNTNNIIISNNKSAVWAYSFRTLNNLSLWKKLSVFALTTTTSPLHFVSSIDRIDSTASSNTCSSISSNHQRFMSSTGSDEVANAQEAAAISSSTDSGAPTIFDKLLSGEWKSDKVYEDDMAFAFRDINPQAPIHIVVIPKHRDGLTQLSKARPDQEALLGHLMYVASQIGKSECPNGFRIVINDGEQGAQSVYHLHLHIIGGRQMGWPPG